MNFNLPIIPPVIMNEIIICIDFVFKFRQNKDRIPFMENQDLQ